MAYDEILMMRIRAMLSGREDVAEKKMFGGICFMVAGNMCCGVTKNQLMLRVGPDRHPSALARPHARPMDFTGRPMRGFVFVDPDGFRADRDLQAWIDMALDFVNTLPPKKKKIRP